MSNELIKIPIIMLHVNRDDKKFVKHDIHGPRPKMEEYFFSNRIGWARSRTGTENMILLQLPTLFKSIFG